MSTLATLRTRKVNRPTSGVRRDGIAVLLLYVAAVVVNLTAVWAVSDNLVLMGEEMSVSIRDVLFSVEQHTQASIWSTNFGAPVYYWIASYLDPSYSLFSARRWKALAMALLAPLIYVALRRRLNCGQSASVVGALTVVLLPGVAMFGWVATENGLEAVAGLSGLLLATSERRGWQAAPILAGVAVTTYTAGLAWAAGIGAACAWRALHSGWRNTVLIAASASVGGLVVAFPRLWWVAGPQRLVAGGGTVDWAALGNLRNLVDQLAVDGRSYYFFGNGTSPASVAQSPCQWSPRSSSPPPSTSWPSRHHRHSAGSPFPSLLAPSWFRCSRAR